MALTNTPVPVPSQFLGGGASHSPAELEWKEALAAIEGKIPQALIVDLSDACNAKSLAAYEFGAAWGLGQFPDVESCMEPYELFGHLEAALTRLGTMVASLKKEIR